jgi:hypothetical protein
VDQSWTGPLQRTSASVPSWLLVQDPRRDRRGRIWLAREVSTRPAASARGLESSASTLKPDIRHNAVRIRVADHGKPHVAPCLRPVEKRRANPLMTSQNCDWAFERGSVSGRTSYRVVGSTMTGVAPATSLTSLTMSSVPPDPSPDWRFKSQSTRRRSRPYAMAVYVSHRLLRS